MPKGRTAYSAGGSFHQIGCTHCGWEIRGTDKKRNQKFFAIHLKHQHSVLTSGQVQDLPGSPMTDTAPIKTGQLPLPMGPQRKARKPATQIKWHKNKYQCFCFFLSFSIKTNYHNALWLHLRFHPRVRRRVIILGTNTWVPYGTWWWNKNVRHLIWPIWIALRVGQSRWHTRQICRGLGPSTTELACIDVPGWEQCAHKAIYIGHLEEKNWVKCNVRPALQRRCRHCPDSMQTSTLCLIDNSNI